MGIYLNPGADAFQEALRSKIDVDKTGLNAKLNKMISTQQKHVCVSRPCRFGKTMAANMVSAYYDHTVTPDVFDELRDSIIAMIAGDRVRVETRSFQNDMTTFQTADDVLELLAHLGYLGYDFASKEAFVPNQEALSEFATATAVSKWPAVADAVRESGKFLQSTWDGNEHAVAAGIEKAHLETSHIQYNDKNALSYTVSLAYYAAREFYTVVRELPAGKGFADLTFIPRAGHLDKPALIVELRWNKSAQTALTQIKDRGYTKALKGSAGEVLLVGVSYDKKSRRHTCKIERLHEESHCTPFANDSLHGKSCNSER